MALWKDILRIAMPIAGTAIGGPIGLAIGGAASKLIPVEATSLLDAWVDFGSVLEGDDELTNSERGDRLRARIRRDLFEATGEEPKERRVNWFMETIAMSINGDFEDDVESE